MPGGGEASPVTSRAAAAVPSTAALCGQRASASSASTAISCACVERAVADSGASSAKARSGRSSAAMHQRTVPRRSSKSWARAGSVAPAGEVLGHALDAPQATVGVAVAHGGGLAAPLEPRGGVLAQALEHVERVTPAVAVAVTIERATSRSSTSAVPSQTSSAAASVQPRWKTDMRSKSCCSGSSSRSWTS